MKQYYRLYIAGQPDAAGLAAGSPSTPTTYSTAAANVFIARHDGDGDSVPDADLLWVRVESLATGRALETLTSR